MTLSKRLWKLPKSTSKKQNIYNIYNNRVKLNRNIHFPCILRLLNNTCVKHNFKSVHVSNLFWSRDYNSAKEICKYPSFSKVGGHYPLDLKIIWSSGRWYWYWAGWKWSGYTRWCGSWMESEITILFTSILLYPSCDTHRWDLSVTQMLYLKISFHYLQLSNLQEASIF